MRISIEQIARQEDLRALAKFWRKHRWCIRCVCIWTALGTVMGAFDIWWAR